jgi:hypothetical protein
MKKHIRNLTILIFPFLFMIIVNESTRPTIKEKPYSKFGIAAIYSVDKNTEKCTWICHNNTTYCKEKHVKYLKNYFAYTDIIYFGIISLLANTGNYGLANIIFLVILLPLLMWFFIIKSLNIQDNINISKKKQ